MGTSVSISIDDRAVRKRLAELVQEHRQQAANALWSEGHAVMALAKSYTPVDKGRLRSTGHVDPPKYDTNGVEVILGFGTKYAIYVHERTELAHKVGRAKFLQTALEERSVGMGSRLAARILSKL